MAIRQQNVLAAQWTPNGSVLGAPDLTAPDNQIFGVNVFSPMIQRQRLPKDVFRRLQQTLAKGEGTGKVARMFGLTAGRISQLRQELAES